jgi:hypothetical protein
MDEQQTCGRGLAENAALPAKLGELTRALGAILEAHVPSLDPTDEPSRKEREVYRRLVDELEHVGAQLGGIARRMDQARDLPMGRHDQAAMGSPAVGQSFRRFVEIEQELRTMLERRLEHDRQMLAAIDVRP